MVGRGERRPCSYLPSASCDSVLANMAAPATLASQAEVLDRIFTGLKDRNPEIRLQSAIELQRYVRSASPACFPSLTRACKVSNTVPDLSSELAARFWDETVTRLSELVHSQTNVEKLGGVLAIGACPSALHACPPPTKTSQTTF